MAASLSWDGEALIERMKAAALAGLLVIDTRVVTNAKGRVRVDTTNLQTHIRIIEEPHEVDGGISSLVGVDDVDYAAAQETGPITSSRHWGFTPYMRPAFDEEVSALMDEIKKAFG